jgi:hypothetical protein
LTDLTFTAGLSALDDAMGKNRMIYAFSPITVISPGGFLAVSYFGNRATTEDIDIFIDPEHVRDKEIVSEMRKVMVEVGEQLHFGRKWINDSVSVFLSPKARVSLFEDAVKQDIVLWNGPNLKVLAAPLEWGLETKLRRLTTKPNHIKAVTDVADILAILTFLTEKNDGPLKRDSVKALNRNGFDVAISEQALDRVAAAYRERYGKEPFC